MTQVESPEWTPASSTCCMTAADHRARPVADRIDVHLDRVLDEPVDQRAGLHRPRQQRGLVVADAHLAPTEDVARADEHRVADPAGDLGGLAGIRSRPPLRGPQPQLVQDRAEPVAVLGDVDRGERRPQDRHAGLLEAACRAGAASGRRTSPRRRFGSRAVSRRPACRSWGPAAIDIAEDRDRFGTILHELGAAAPEWGTAPKRRRGRQIASLSGAQCARATSSVAPRCAISYDEAWLLSRPVGPS